eukprot:CAMPEP_0197238994 /NCGR_PEP_ID=MMETSP1429-20130617/5491_1 /TAXON_ID=49237 /ORGANISM="Chaetoceros  sp., Strain UNC1202" /LENGTH=130 /DNA_ID=CAMNT_0042698295 /DNA_START=44 /DNA_END=433 /DNA_ORIENTATION=+
MREYGFHSIRTIEVRLREHYVDDVELDIVPTSKLPRDLNVNNYVPGKESGGDSNTEKDTKAIEKENDTTTDMETDGSDNNNQQSSSSSSDHPPAKKRKLLCARPFSMMRGHSAFLTFATAGNKAHPDPNE